MSEMKNIIFLSLILISSRAFCETFLKGIDDIPSYKNMEYNELNTTINFKNLSANFNFIKESGDMGDDSIFDYKTTYKINEDNFINFNTRRNRKLSLTEYYNLVYEYKNDCLTAGIKYNKTFYEDRELKPTENLLFTITLFPLTTYEYSADELVND